VWIVDDDRPLAFTGGWFRPRIHISTATEQGLAAEELAAVLAHEDCHRRQRDPLRMAAARVAARTLAFIPGLCALADRHAQTIELAADEAAAQAASPKTLASALLRLGAAQNGDSDPDVCRIAPERVDRLAGRPIPRLGSRHAVLLFLGAIALGAVAIESFESARTAPVEVAVVAAQLCSVGGLALSSAVLLTARHRRSSDPAKARASCARPRQTAPERLFRRPGTVSDRSL
jgi:Zn-dependent protease with chaperone function